MKGDPLGAKRPIQVIHLPALVLLICAHESSTALARFARPSHSHIIDDIIVRGVLWGASSAPDTPRAVLLHLLERGIHGATYSHGMLLLARLLTVMLLRCILLLILLLRRIIAIVLMMRSFSDKYFICIALLLADVSKISSDIIEVLLSLLFFPYLFFNIIFLILKCTTLLLILYLLSIIVFKRRRSPLRLLTISAYF